MARFRRHFAGRLEHGFGQRLQIGGAVLRLGGDGADVIVADAEIVADLDVMGILVGRSGNIADLKDGELAQPRIELGAVADVVADPAPAARGARTVDQSPKQIDRPVEQILMLGRQIRAVRNREPVPSVLRSVSGYSLGFSTARTEVSGITPPRWRASVSRPDISQSPAAARLANFSQVSVQSPRW